MNEFEKKLADFISDNGINAEHLIFETSCHTVEEACASCGATPEDFVKNVSVVNKKTGEFMVAIVPGEKKLDWKKLYVLVGSRDLRMATSEEVLEKTGFPAGGTPSFGYAARFFIDNGVFEKKLVYSGGGSTFALTRVSTDEILRANQGTKADLAKD
ncbi:TPA: hypothetical protein HA244_04395 [Candidatus Micrarchaeota archaeon]|nr:hypothetical protein [Candidatus Micrarchaeota archaeon]